MSAVYLGTVEPLVFHPTTVKEFGSDFPFDPERMVPPTLPTFTETCPNPDCRGTGVIDLDDWPWVDGCPTCGGKGTVERLWRAEEQWRVVQTEDTSWTGRKGDIITEWVSDPEVAVRPPMVVERRLAVVSWYEPIVLPVVNDDELDEDAARRNMVRIFHTEDGNRGVCLNDDRDHPVLVRNVADKPWAQNLTPGCVVVLFGEEHRLREPITEMDIPLVGMPDLDERVPLVLSPGLNVGVELVLAG